MTAELEGRTGPEDKEVSGNWLLPKCPLNSGIDDLNAAIFLKQNLKLWNAGEQETRRRKAVKPTLTLTIIDQELNKTEGYTQDTGLETGESNW